MADPEDDIKPQGPPPCVHVWVQDPENTHPRAEACSRRGCKDTRMREPSRYNAQLFSLVGGGARTGPWVVHNDYCWKAELTQGVAFMAIGTGTTPGEADRIARARLNRAAVFLLSKQ